MLRDDGLLLDIYSAGKRIVELTSGFTIEEIADDDMRLSAILYKFIVVGEAAKRISFESREDHPESPWADMAGMRDVLAHQYDNVKVDLLRRAIQVSLPTVLGQIALLLPKEE